MRESRLPLFYRSWLIVAAAFAALPAAGQPPSASAQALPGTNPDDGKLYCFSSGTSLEFFLDEPQAHIDRARAAWRKLTDR